MADSVDIRRLQLRGPGAAGRDVAARARRELEQAPWPERPREQVFIRRLVVAGRLAGLGRRVAQGVARLLDAPAGSDLVRFEDEAQLVAALSADLLDGTAPARWWWRGHADVVRRPKADGLALLWARHPESLVAACAILARRGRLARAFDTLDEPGAAAVVLALARRLATPVSPWAAAVPARATEARPLSRDVARRWAPVVGGRPVSSFRTQLAAVLALLEGAPLAVTGPRATAAVAAAALQLGAAPRRATSTEPTEVTPRRETTLPEAQLSPPAQPAAPIRDEAAPPASPAATPSEVSALDAPLAPDDAPLAPDAAATLSEALDLAVADEAETIASSFAGALLIVNALQSAPARAWIEELGLLEERSSGWRLLAGVAASLGLPEDEALADWMQRVADALEEPPLSAAAVAPLGARLAAAYGPELWARRLIAITGTIRATRTHVDVLLPLAAVRLDVRRAGLDLDAGWVPWLGRVVTLHYREEGAR